MRPSTGDTLGLLPRRAASRLQTEISHADRNFSIALGVLHAVDMASVALQHKKAREEGVCHSAALKKRCCFLNLRLCFSSGFGFSSLFLQVVVLVAAVDGARGMGTFREGGMEASAQKKNTQNESIRKCDGINSKI